MFLFRRVCHFGGLGFGLYAAGCLHLSGDGLLNHGDAPSICIWEWDRLGYHHYILRPEHPRRRLN